MDQGNFLLGHPIFTPKVHLDSPLGLNPSPEFRKSSERRSFGLNGPAKERIGRRAVMALRDYDLLLAMDNEIRITSLVQAKDVKPQERSYKTLYTPTIQFDIHQIAINPNGKLLAVAGSRQVAVVSLPRNYSKFVPSLIDCRTIQIGQIYHGSTTSVPVAKVGWHPWGKDACSLLVMTVDGVLREYDVSVDPEEPQQVTSFMPERPQTSFVLGDSSAREVVSYCLGKGKADWGPLTVYALTKSGDIWAVCPFLPSNANVPSVYICALEYFVRAKQDTANEPTLINDPASNPPEKPLSSIYAYQLKYVISLLKQIPESSTVLSSSRSVHIRAPHIVKAKPARQGPFLLQPAPLELDGEGGDATDLIYLEQAGSSPLQLDDMGDDERLGVLAIAYSDGKVDVCLDVEKIEAQWETDRSFHANPNDTELPLLMVYESIDLGLVSALKRAISSPRPSLSFEKYREQDILRLNRPVFVPDPIYQDTVYLYHACGVHSLNFSPWLQPLLHSMRQGIDKAMVDIVAKGVSTEVRSIISTFSPRSRSSKPIYGLTLPGDVYLSYNLHAVSNSWEIHVRDLVLRVNEEIENPKTETSDEVPVGPDLSEFRLKDKSLAGFLLQDPFKVPMILTPEGIEDIRRLKQNTPRTSTDFQITPELLRSFAMLVHNFQTRIRDTLLATSQLQNRMMLQDKEFVRQQVLYVELMTRTKQLREERHQKLAKRFEVAMTEQRRLLTRSDKILQQLMDSSSPTLNEPEKLWFAELRRMKADIFGETSYDAGSLRARTESLSNRLELYLPSLQEVSKRERERLAESRRQAATLGHAQEQRLLMRLGEHKKSISDAIKLVEDMARRMDVKLKDVPEVD